MAINSYAGLNVQTELGSYQGRPTIKISEVNSKGKYPVEISFGVGKAKAILAAIEDIREFVVQNDRQKGEY